MNIQLVLVRVISNMELSGVNLDVLNQNYQKYITFTAILKYDHSYKIVQCHVSLCKHIILMKQLNRKENMVSSELLMIKYLLNYMTFCEKITKHALPTLGYKYTNKSLRMIINIVQSQEYNNG